MQQSQRDAGFLFSNSLGLWAKVQADLRGGKTPASDRQEREW